MHVIIIRYDVFGFVSPIVMFAQDMIEQIATSVDCAMQTKVFVGSNMESSAIGYQIGLSAYQSRADPVPA